MSQPDQMKAINSLQFTMNLKDHFKRRCTNWKLFCWS